MDLSHPAHIYIGLHKVWINHVAWITFFQTSESSNFQIAFLCVIFLGEYFFIIKTLPTIPVSATSSSQGWYFLCVDRFKRKWSRYYKWISLYKWLLKHSEEEECSYNIFINLPTKTSKKHWLEI